MGDELEQRAKSIFDRFREEDGEVKLDEEEQKAIRFHGLKKSGMIAPPNRKLRRLIDKASRKKSPRG